MFGIAVGAKFILDYCKDIVAVIQYNEKFIENFRLDLDSLVVSYEVENRLIWKV